MPLATDIFGIGFKTADRIAGQLGISPDSLERAQAGVLHVLGELPGDGHLFCPRPKLVEAAPALLAVEPDVIERAIDALAGAGEVAVAAVASGNGQVSPDPAVYLASLHTAESGGGVAPPCAPRNPGQADRDRHRPGARPVRGMAGNCTRSGAARGDRLRRHEQGAGGDRRPGDRQDDARWLVARLKRRTAPGSCRA